MGNIGVEKLPASGNDFGVLECLDKGCYGICLGDAIGVEKEGEVARHLVKSLIIGGSEPTVVAVLNKDDLGVVLLDESYCFVCGCVVDDDNFVYRMGLECG